MKFELNWPSVFRCLKMVTDRRRSDWYTISLWLRQAKNTPNSYRGSSSKRGEGRVQLSVIVLNSYVPKQNKVMCPSIHHRKCHNHRRTNCNVRSFYLSNATDSLNFEHYAIIHNII